MSALRRILLTVAVPIVMIGCCQFAQADPLVLSLQNNSLAGVAGGTVTFVGSAFNSGATNTNTVTITNVFGASPFAVDFTEYVANFHQHMVASGNTIGPLTEALQRS